MQAMGIEVTEGEFLGINDFITALDSPLPNERRRRKKNKTYSFGSAMEQEDLPEVLSEGETEPRNNLYTSPTSKSDILTNSDKVKKALPVSNDSQKIVRDIEAEINEVSQVY
jgi:hypothetical protein